MSSSDEIVTSSTLPTDPPEKQTASPFVFELVDEAGGAVPLRFASDTRSAENPTAVFADRAYALHVDVNAAASAKLNAKAHEHWDETFFACSLYLNGAYVETRLRMNPDGTVLVCPVRDASGTLACLFSDTFGYAGIRLVANSNGATFSIEAEPVAVLLPEGHTSETIAAMTRYVEARYDEFLSVENGAPAGCTVLRKHEAGLEERRSVYDEALRAFEIAAHARGGSSGSRFRLQTKLSSGGGHGTSSLSQAAAYIASHPYLLEPSSSGGIRVGRRSFVPRGNGRSDYAKPEAAYEKRAVLGYLDLLAERLGEERTAAEQIAGERGLSAQAQGYADAASKSGINFTAARVHADALSSFETRAKATRARLAKLFDESAIRLTGLPKKTPLFASVEPFKNLFKAMTSAEALGRAEFRSERAVLAFLGRSRLYELYALLRVLEGIRAKGFRLTSKHRFAYPEEKLYADTIRGIDGANTFVFVRNKGNDASMPVRLTVFYEPVIRPAHKGSRNGMELCRTNLFSVNGATGDFRIVSKKRGFYTPDIVVAAEGKGGRTWFVADAKYSTKATVLLKHGLELAFRYLLSIAPLNARDKFAGVWFMLGKEDEKWLPSSLNHLGRESGAAIGPDMNFEFVLPEREMDRRGFVETVCKSA